MEIIQPGLLCDNKVLRYRVIRILAKDTIDVIPNDALMNRRSFIIEPDSYGPSRAENPSNLSKELCGIDPYNSARYV